MACGRAGRVPGSRRCTSRSSRRAFSPPRFMRSPCHLPTSRSGRRSRFSSWFRCCSSCRSSRLAAPPSRDAHSSGIAGLFAAMPSRRKGDQLMKPRTCCLLLGLMSGLAGATAGQAQQAPAVEVLAEYPAGNFLENLDVLPDGRVVFTSYFAKEIEVLEGGKARTFARLSAHPVSILGLARGFLVAAHGQTFVSGAGFVEQQD